jgi:hypothetical protein
VKRCPINRSARIEYETDAENDYFSRSLDPGKMETKGILKIISIHLWNGKATVRFSLPESCRIGDVFNIDTYVSDISRSTPFHSNFSIQVDEAAEETEPYPRPPKYSGLVGIPRIIEIHKSDYEKYNMDEYSALEIRHGDDDNLDVLVNMDNIYLMNEILKRRSYDPEIIKYWYKYGLFLLSMGMLYDQKKIIDSSESKEGYDFSPISTASRGLAVTIIPVMIQLKKNKSE